MIRFLADENLNIAIVQAVRRQAPYCSADDLVLPRPSENQNFVVS